MARVYTKKTSRVEHTCGRTGHIIPKGEGYYAAAPGFRGREIYRCFKHPFRPSELTTGLQSGPLSALEELQDTIEGYTDEPDYDGLREAVQNFASSVREYAEERQTALDAWENGNSTLEDLLYTAESAADEAEDIENNIDDFDEEEPTAEEYEDEDEFDLEHEAWDTRRQEAWEEAKSNALDAAQSIEF